MSNTIFKNTLIYGIGNISQKGVSFILVFLYTHYLTPGDIGIINTLQAFSAVLLLFLCFGLERTIYRLYHDYDTEEKKRNFLGTINIAIVIISGFVVLLLLIVGINIKQVFGLTFYPFILLATIDALTSALTISPKLVFQVKGKPWPFLALLLGNSILSLALVFMVLKLGHTSVVYVLCASVLASLIFLPIEIFVMIKNMNFVFDLKILKSALKYSLPLLPSLLSAWVLNLSDRLFLKAYFNFAEVGYYSVAYKTGQAVQLFAVAVLMAYNPYFYSLANATPVDKVKLNAHHNNNILFLLFISFAVALLSKDFIGLVLNKDYLNVAYLVPLVILGYFFIQMVGLQNLSFHQMKLTVLLMKINLVMSVANIGLNFLLIPKYGMIGAVSSTIITQLILFLITYYWSIKVYFLRINFKMLFVLGGIMALIVVSTFSLKVTIANAIIKLIILLVIALSMMKFKIVSFSK